MGLQSDLGSALITDAIRANLLERQGYETQILEFIDMEHTPKNLLIRAVKKTRHMEKKQAGASLEETMEPLGVHPTLARLLDRNK